MQTITKASSSKAASPAELVSTGFQEPVSARPSNRDFDVMVYVSEHAQDRWCQRVHPHTTRREALVELVRVLQTGGFRVKDTAPRWKAPNGNESVFYLMVGAEIALPVGYREEEPNAVEAKTCLTPMGQPGNRRSRNRHPRRERR